MNTVNGDNNNMLVQFEIHCNICLGYDYVIDYCSILFKYKEMWNEMWKQNSNNSN